MTLVILTGNGPEHRYVTNRLCRELDIAAVLVETGPALGPRGRARQLRRRYSIPQLGSRALLAAYKRLVRDAAAHAEQLDAVLGAASRSFEVPALITEVPTVNRPEAHALVEQLAPSRLLVYGTGIVGASMLERSRLTPLNMHTGISPHYRGSACAFWPIHDGRPEMVGATVHEITATVDGGAIYATARAELQAGDGIHAVFARAVVAGAGIYVDTVRRLDGRDEPGTPQDLSVGREYRAHMRGLRAELRARRRLAAGLLGPLSSR